MECQLRSSPYAGYAVDPLAAPDDHRNGIEGYRKTLSWPYVLRPFCNDGTG
jgi:hypothetical protein